MSGDNTRTDDSMTLIPKAARQLGYAGLLPQVICALYVFDGGKWQWTAQAMAFGYAALIFSFLGGLWWGIALTREDAPRWLFGCAVMPSLLALAAYAPWILGWDWPGPSLMAVGIMLVVSPLVDCLIAGLDPAWLALRLRLSLGLGGLTILIGLAAMFG